MVMRKKQNGFANKAISRAVTDGTASERDTKRAIVIIM